MFPRFRFERSSSITEMADETAKKTPSQDAQGRWHELLSPTQVLTDENQDVQKSTVQVMPAAHNERSPP